MKDRGKKATQVPRKILIIFLSVGIVFIVQLVWWIIFFIDTVGDSVQPRHYRMLITEGLFFIVLVFVGLSIIYRSLKQQVRIRQQIKDFFAGFSHELKTPIASMMLQAETMQSLDLPREKQIELLGNMVEDLDRLELTIENILDVFRIEAGRLNLDVQPVEVDSWLESTVNQSIRYLDDSKYNVTFSLRAATTVDLDDRYFHTVISNIIQNSIRYSTGPLDLHVSSSLEDNEVEIRIKDNGIGIDQEKLKQVFDRYYRIEGVEEFNHKGSGIGLFLTQLIVEAHAGRIWAESEGRGKGTEFIIRIPSAEK